MFYGATHSFIFKGMTKELGPKTGINTSRIKAVNYQARHVEEVRICWGNFEGRMDFMVIEMDDFELIIRNTFMRTSKVGLFQN